MSHGTQIVENGQHSNGVGGSPSEDGAGSRMQQISTENTDVSKLKRLHSNSRTTDPPTDGESYTKRAREIAGSDLLTDISTAEAAPDGIAAPLLEASNQAKQYRDPWCDPAFPREIRFETISAAHLKIRGGIERTPCARSLQLSTLTKMDLHMKKEFLQVTGSFKERGARYTLLCLSKDQKEKGVIAASAGNHALALCYHGQQLGIPVTVVMPVIAPIMKISRCRTFGATVIVNGADLGESKEYAMRIADEQGLMYVNGYDHPHILAGQGTMALEIIDQVPDLDAVIIPVGGAGLIAGCAVAVKTLCPNVKVIGVEAANCPSFTNAMAAGKPVYTKPKSSLADGLAVPLVGGNAFRTAQKLVDKIVVVREEFIALSILRLVEMEKAVVEGAGATAEFRKIGLAAILQNELPELEGKRVVVALCGGNIDTTVLGRCLDRGLAVDGRLCRFVCTVSDRPGGIAELASWLANLGASIKDIIHERTWCSSDVYMVRVRVTCETRDWQHLNVLETTLKQHYAEVDFHPQF